MKMWTVFRKDKGSLYWLYRRLIDFRREHVALTEGSYKPLKASGDLLLFCRELREERVLIALSMGLSLSRSHFLMKNCLGAFFYLHL